MVMEVRAMVWKQVCHKGSKRTFLQVSQRGYHWPSVRSWLQLSKPSNYRLSSSSISRTLRTSFCWFRKFAPFPLSSFAVYRERKCRWKWRISSIRLHSNFDPRALLLHRYSGIYRICILNLGTFLRHVCNAIAPIECYLLLCCAAILANHSDSWIKSSYLFCSDGLAIVLFLFGLEVSSKFRPMIFLLLSQPVPFVCASMTQYWHMTWLQCLHLTGCIGMQRQIEHLKLLTTSGIRVEGFKVSPCTNKSSSGANPLRLKLW